MSTQRYRWLVTSSALLMVGIAAAFTWNRIGHSNHGADDQSVLTGVISCFTLDQPSYAESPQGKSQYDADSYVKAVLTKLESNAEKKPTTSK